PGASVGTLPVVPARTPVVANTSGVTPSGRSALHSGTGVRPSRLFSSATQPVGAGNSISLQIRCDRIDAPRAPRAALVAYALWLCAPAAPADRRERPNGCASIAPMSLLVLAAVRVSECSHLFLLATVLDRSPDVQREHRHHDQDSHDDHDHDRGQVGG